MTQSALDDLEASDHEPTDWRRILLNVVTVAMMVVSISGQVQVLADRYGQPLAIVFAVAHDIAAILALDISVVARTTAIRAWAWVATLLAAGTGGALNAFHASHDPISAPGAPLKFPPLPIELAYWTGIEPIVAILVLSHLVGLYISDARERRTVRPDRQDAAGRQEQPTVRTVGEEVADRQVETVSRSAEATVSKTVSGSEVSIGTDRQVTATFTAVAAAADRQVELPVAERPTERPALPPAARTNRTPAPLARPRALAAVRSESEATPRYDWITDELLAAVVQSTIDAQAKGEKYGRPALMADTGLKNWKAQELLKYVKEHPELLRASA